MSYLQFAAKHGHVLNHKAAILVCPLDCAAWVRGAVLACAPQLQLSRHAWVAALDPAISIDLIRVLIRRNVCPPPKVMFGVSLQLHGFPDLVCFATHAPMGCTRTCGQACTIVDDPPVDKVCSTILTRCPFVYLSAYNPAREASDTGSPVGWRNACVQPLRQEGGCMPGANSRGPLSG